MIATKSGALFKIAHKIGESRVLQIDLKWTKALALIGSGLGDVPLCAVHVARLCTTKYYRSLQLRQCINDVKMWLALRSLALATFHEFIR